MFLRGQIEHEIRQHGPMPFSRYMEICLYDPARGYYSRHAEQFGKAGDFYTSSDVHAVFGRLLARQLDEMWQALDRPPRIEILELGPGRGLMARDLLDWSQKKFPDFFAALTYTLQETSPALRAKLTENLRERIAGSKAVFPPPQRLVAVKTRLAASQITDALPTEDQTSPKDRHDGATDDRTAEGRAELAQRFRACNVTTNDQVREGGTTILRVHSPATPLIVVANEFFDALPVEVLSSQGKLHLAARHRRLHEIWLPPAPQELEFLDRYGVHPEPGERIEVALAAQRWVTSVADALQRGFLIVIDYGYTRAEQLAGRHRGTLMTYRQHSASANPYEAPGEQDITAHVNFTALAVAAEQAGMCAGKLRTQAQFLMGIGEKNQFADAFADCRLPQERAKVALQLKHLVTPAGMGESFQVLVASRKVEPERVAALSGLSSPAKERSGDLTTEH